MISVLVPVFNEEHNIEQTLNTLHGIFAKEKEEFELIVINDGSTDKTADALHKLKLAHLTVLSHPQNRGYSASLKTGIRHSKGNLIAMVDADQTYPLEDFPILLKKMRETQADMVVGARTKKGAKIPLLRKPAKMVVNALARFLTGTKIPDLNSGMRIFTRTLGEQFMHLYPQRFSFTITITLGALTNDYSVEYVPIHYFKRSGKSSMSSGFNGIKNFGNFLSLIIRMITYFRPLRFFIWPSVILFVGGLALAIDTIVTQQNVSDSGLLLLVSGLQIGLFGLLAESVVRSNRRIL